MSQRDSSSHLGVMGPRICLCTPPTCLNRVFRHPDGLPFSVPSSLITPNWWYRNINLFPINYAFRPRLRDRLTLRGLPLLRKPWAYGVPVFHRHYRYSCQHTLFCLLQRPSRVHLRRLAECSPTICPTSGQIHSFGNVLSPVEFSARVC